MKLKAPAIIRKGKSWFIGTIEGFDFTEEKKVQKFADIGKVEDWISLKEYLKKHNFSESLEDRFLKEIVCDSIFISKEEPSSSILLTEKEAEKYWWNERNSLCIKCTKECKQSGFAQVISCTIYQEEHRE